MSASDLLAAAPAAKSLLSKLTSKPLEELGEILGDRVRLWRWKNQIQILQQAHEIAAQNRLDVKPIALKALVPLLDGASLEEDASIQQLWARLIANAGATEASVGVTTFAVEFLKGITSHEARIVEGMVGVLEKTDRNGQMEALHLEFAAKPNTEFKPFRHISRKRMDMVGLPEKAFDIALDNLIRFNVVARDMLYDMDGRPSAEGFTFTRLGWEVVRLVREPGQPSLGSETHGRLGG